MTKEHYTTNELSGAKKAWAVTRQVLDDWSRCSRHFIAKSVGDVDQ